MTRIVMAGLGAAVAIAVVAFAMTLAGLPPTYVGIGCTIAAAAVAAAVVRKGATACPRCGTQMATFRQPTSLKQAFLGGWTCPKCGCEIDRSGHAIS